MKKLLSITLLLLFVSLFFSCSDDASGDNTGGSVTPAVFDDWNSPESANYKADGYNPILGKWAIPDSSIVLVFSENFEFEQFIWDEENGRVKSFTRKYKINDKAFKMDVPVYYSLAKTDMHSYLLSGDQLLVSYTTNMGV